MIKTKLTIEVHHVTLPVLLNSDGQFWCEWEGDGITAPSFEALRKKVTSTVQPVQRCAVVAVRSSYSGIASTDARKNLVTLLGIHSGNKNLLFVYQDVQEHKHSTSTQQASRNEKFYRVLTDAEIVELERLEKVAATARKAVEVYAKRFQIDAVALVYKALKLPPPPKEPRSTQDDLDEDEE